jgi:hypothetical protein
MLSHSMSSEASFFFYCWLYRLLAGITVKKTDRSDGVQVLDLEIA